MNLTKHLSLLFQAVCVWAVFWVAGMPSYYQQYSPIAIAVGSILLSVLISLAAVFVLRRVKPENRMTRACWLSFYYTVPLAALDALYCGVYLAQGLSFLYKYWYLSIFYVTPWLTFIPTAMLLGQEETGSRKKASSAV
jgi:hypothetical protein